MILTKADNKKGATEARQAGRGHMPCRSCERLLSTFQVPQEPNKGFAKESDSGDVHCLKIMVAVAGRGLKRRPRRLGQDSRGWTSPAAATRAGDRLACVLEVAPVRLGV